MSRGRWHPGGHHGLGPPQVGSGDPQDGPRQHSTVRPPPSLAPPQHHSSSHYYTQPHQHQGPPHPKHFIEPPPSRRNYDENHEEQQPYGGYPRESPRGYFDQRTYSHQGSHIDRIGYSDQGDFSDRGGHFERRGSSNHGRNFNRKEYSDQREYVGGNYANQPFESHAELHCYESERQRSVSKETYSEGRVTASHPFPEISGQSRNQPSFQETSGQPKNQPAPQIVPQLFLPSPVYSHPPPSIPSASPRCIPSPGPSAPPAPSLAPPPAPHIGSLTPESQRVTRDPRRRQRGEASDDERPSGSRSGGLGIRNDIYAPPAPCLMEDREGGTYHQPEAAPFPQPEENEVKFADTDAFSKMPDSTVVDVEEETKEGKVDSVSTSYRCTFCPSPGLIPLAEKITHQVRHCF